MQTGVKLTLLPLANPNSSANNTRPAVDFPAGSQMHNTAMILKVTESTMVLYLPILSAKNPGSHRPKKDPTFIMGRISNASAWLKPWLNAYELMYVIGTKRPHSIK
jgi:hypothetical protein